MEEIHLFIIWSKALNKKAEIVEDISKKFLICDIFNITWSRDSFSKNLSRFYGQNLPKNSSKEKHCGTGTFCCIIVKDRLPVYEVRETSKGARVVNVKLFDSKQLYRDWTGGGHKIHATDDVEETKTQLALLFNKKYSDYFSINHFKGESDYYEDLVGTKGWSSFDEIFTFLNRLSINYVVLRNFDNLEEQLDSEHPDVDLLVENKNLVADVLGAVKTSSKNYRVQYVVLINNKEICFDLRHLGDNYYDYSWEFDILKNRVKHEKGFYIPDSINLYYSLIYHAIIHKKGVSKDYINQFLLLSKKKGINNNLPDMTSNKLLNLLLEFMHEKRYSVVEPIDLSVYFNTLLLGNSIFINESQQRKLFYLRGSKKRRFLYGLIKIKLNLFFRRIF